MIVITGGAGFIGSNLVASLNERGVPDITISDNLGADDKWLNLRKHEFTDIVTPEHLFTYLEKNKAKISTLLHFGAVSSTTESNVDLLIEQNFQLSKKIWYWCAENNVQMIYASSSTTYGAGEFGFEDRSDIEYLKQLRPLAPYGWSKHLFDMFVANQVRKGAPAPPKWIGAKLFNIYGPNEYHKDDQQSVMFQKFPRAEHNLRITLYRSENEEYADGEQMRDFIYVEDCCDMILWLMENNVESGLYNIGSGVASTFNEVADCLFRALGQENAQVEYVDMPAGTHNHYQYKTEANISKLQKAGYDKRSLCLSNGVKKYVQEYLRQLDIYR